MFGFQTFIFLADPKLLPITENITPLQYTDEASSSDTDEDLEERLENIRKKLRSDKQKKIAPPRKPSIDEEEEGEEADEKKKK